MYRSRRFYLHLALLVPSTKIDLCTVTYHKGVFRTQSNIYYGAICENSERLEAVSKKAPSWMFDWALIRLCNTYRNSIEIVNVFTHIKSHYFHDSWSFIWISAEFISHFFVDIFEFNKLDRLVAENLTFESFTFNMIRISPPAGCSTPSNN